MSTRISWLITDRNITVNYQGQTHIVKRSDPLSTDLIQALKEGRLNDLPNLISKARAMEHQSKGNVQFRDGELFVKGAKVPAELAKKIQQFMDEGLPYEPLVKFAENLQRNPSFRAVNELFQFLEKNDHPLTENGNFIAYKRVRSDFKDIYSGEFDNSPGQEPEVPRNEVDEDCNRTCSKGLHVANWWYASSQYGNAETDLMLEVEVDPASVVAIPVDYNQAKMRVCKYKVLGVVENEYTGSALRVVNPELTDEEEEMEEENEGCTECGNDLCCDDTLCDTCLDEQELEEEEEREEEEYMDECIDCGCEVDPGYDRCQACEDDYQADEEDEYPWEDEV